MLFVNTLTQVGVKRRDASFSLITTFKHVGDKKIGRNSGKLDPIENILNDINIFGSFV